MSEQFTQADLNDVTASLIGRGFKNVVVELEDEDDATVIVAGFDDEASVNVNWREMVEYFEGKYGFCSYPEPAELDNEIENWDDEIITRAEIIIERK